MSPARARTGSLDLGKSVLTGSRPDQRVPPEHATTITAINKQRGRSKRTGTTLTEHFLLGENEVPQAAFWPDGPLVDTSSSMTNSKRVGLTSATTGIPRKYQPPIGEPDSSPKPRETK